MVSYTAWQIAKALIFYSLVAVAIPALVLGEKLKGKSFAMRFFTYFTVGNLYIINIVYLLELFHLSYKVTLIIFTIVPAFLLYMFVHRRSTVQLAENTYVATERLARGTYGFKTWFVRTITGIAKGIVAGLKNLWSLFYKNIPDIILTIAILVVCWIFFGRFSLEQYGYGASDMIVHNYWINGLDANHLFIDGVYPFGFHNIIYYLHQIFGIEIMDLLRVFWVVTLMYTALIMVIFLRSITRSKYVVYLGVFCYLALNICVEQATSRYYSALPQEFGMLFVPIGVFYALEFFKLRKIEVDEIKAKKNKLENELETEQGETKKRLPKGKKFKISILALSPSTYMLAGVAANVAISFTIHSYVTIIMALIFFGIAVGYCVRFFNYRYFFRVIASVVAGMIIALIPMGLALLSGNHLQGSFNWGMSVIKGEPTKAEDISFGTLLNGREIDQALIDEIWEYKDSIPVESDGETIYIKQAVNLANIEEEYANAMANKAEATGISLEDLMAKELQNVTKHPATEVVEEQGAVQKLLSKLEEFGQKIQQVYEQEFEYILLEDNYNLVIWFIAAIIIVGVLGMCFIIAGNHERGFTYLSFFVASFFLAVGFRGTIFGLPQIFDILRVYGLTYYFLWIYPVLAVDGILFLLLGLWEKKSCNVTMGILSALIMAGGTISVVTGGNMRTPEHEILYGTNGAVITTTNIIQSDKDGTWTIVSANDENQTAAGHGYHYEITEFLRNMEYYYTDYVGTGADSKEVGMNVITIPSEKVYFFIEKRPLNYTDEGYDLSGSLISEEAAKCALDNHKGLYSYQDYNRNICMSRMMAWAERFNEIYPNEFNIYYEDEEFVCYEIIQNAYSLYNFAIDYGYNTTDFESYHANDVVEEN